LNYKNDPQLNLVNIPLALKNAIKGRGWIGGHNHHPMDGHRA
jgi:hypothetical protein